MVLFRWLHSIRLLKLLLICIPLTTYANPIVSRVLKSGIKSIGKQTLKSNSTRVARLALKYGDESIDLVRMGGPRLQKVLDNASFKEGKNLLSFFQKTGSSGLRILDDPKLHQLILKHGDDIGQLVARHSGNGVKLVSKHGSSSIKSLNRLNRVQGQRLYIVSKQGKLAQVSKLSSTEQSKFWNILSQRGNAVLKWIEHNPKTTLTVATLTAFIAQPDKFLDGVGSILEKIGQGVVIPVLLASLPYLALLGLIFGLVKLSKTKSHST